MAEKDIGTGRMVKEVDSYLKSVSSTNWDYKKEDLGFRTRFLLTYFKPVNGESLLEYYNKILKGINDRRFLESFATTDFLEMTQEDQNVIIDMVVQFINYADRGNLIELVNHTVNSDFVGTVCELGAGRTTEEPSKFKHLEDYIGELDADDIPVLLERIKDVGVMADEVNDLASGLQVGAPLLIAEMRNANFSAELENMVFDMISSVDLLQTLILVIKKLKYVSKRGGGRVIQGGYNPSKSSYIGDIGDRVDDSRNALSREEIEDKLDNIYGYLEDVVTRPVADIFKDLVEGSKNYVQVGSDIIAILSGRPHDVSDKLAYIKARVFEGLNQKVEALGVSINTDTSILTQAFYYLSALAGSTNPVVDVMNVLGTSTRHDIVEPRDFEIGSLMQYTYLTNDTTPLTIYATMMKDYKLGQLIQVLYSKDKRGDYLMSIEHMEELIKEKQPRFNGAFQLTDIRTALNVFSGGVNKGYGLSQDDLQEFAELILAAVND